MVGRKLHLKQTEIQEEALKRLVRPLKTDNEFVVRIWYPGITLAEMLQRTKDYRYDIETDSFVKR